MKKPSLIEVKAAMALACRDDVQWVRAPITFEGVQYIVAQVMPERGPEACAVFRAYGIDDERTITGENCAVLMPVPVEAFSDIKELRAPLVLQKGQEYKTKNKFLRQLHDANIAVCEVTYSGEGDSSNPSEFNYNIAPFSFNADWGTTGYKWLEALSQAGDVMPAQFEGAVHAWIYEELASDYDTYNNDGGGGTLIFDLTNPGQPVVTFTLYQNVTTQEEHINSEI